MYIPEINFRNTLISCMYSIYTHTLTDIEKDVCSVCFLAVLWILFARYRHGLKKIDQCLSEEKANNLGIGTKAFISPYHLSVSPSPPPSHFPCFITVIWTISPRHWLMVQNFLHGSRPENGWSDGSLLWETWPSHETVSANKKHVLWIVLYLTT